MNYKSPPYRKELQDRLCWKNIPELGVMIPVRNDFWSKAKDLRKPNLNDFEVLELPENENPFKYKWPVKNCPILILRDMGPSDQQMLNLVKALLRDGATIVKVHQENFVIRDDVAKVKDSLNPDKFCEVWSQLLTTYVLEQPGRLDVFESYQFSTGFKMAIHYAK